MYLKRLAALAASLKSFRDNASNHAYMQQLTPLFRFQLKMQRHIISRAHARMVSAQVARSCSLCTSARHSAAAPKKLDIQPFALKHLTGYINGKWVPAVGGGTLGVPNPATGEYFATVSDMKRPDTEAAITAAADAFPAWAAKTAGERAALLRKMYDLMVKHSDGLAALLTQECGKPFEESKGEIAYAASFFEFYAEEAKRMYGDVIPAPRADRKMLALRQPVGVAALLTPWNFSSAMVTRKLAPALAAGCTVVIRPSANTPLSALAVAQLAEEAGIPAGVVNIVVGHDHDEIAGTLCSHPAVKKVSFTGSTRVGKLLMKQCASTLKKMSLELGGNAPFIVFEDADLDAAVEGAIASKFRNAGQTCVCANRMFVHESVYAEFRKRLVEKVAALKVGDGMHEGTKVGPVITEGAMLKTEAFVRDAVGKGAKVAFGGKRASHVNNGKGWFFEPTVLENVTQGMDVMTDEIFGPVAPLASFKTEEEVLALANNVDVGLAGYFFTKDFSRAWRVAEKLDVGMVGLNTGIISTAAAPFGGVKQSGFGREGSKYGLDEYTTIKYVMMGI